MIAIGTGKRERVCSFLSETISAGLMSIFRFFIGLTVWDHVEEHPAATPAVPSDLVQTAALLVFGA
ncbi:hypothetical protein BH11PSE5_BH11PSE5_26160 [soil metagenome]